MRNLNILYYFIILFNFLYPVFYCYINDNIIKNDKILNANLKHKNERKNLGEDDNKNNSNEININLEDESLSAEEEHIFYNNNEVDNFGYEKILFDISNLSDNDIIKLYKEREKKISYSDIYKFLLSKNKGNNAPRNWPLDFNTIKDKSKLKSKKSQFRKTCKKFIIGENSRLYQFRTLNSLFDGKTYILKYLILFNKEAEQIINFFHVKLGHMGINVLQYEIERRGIYINRLTNIIKSIINKCEICAMHKLNSFIKPYKEQIISKKPLERIQCDITYFNKKIEFTELKNKYLLNIKDHFSKYCQSYIIQDKTTETCLSKLKDFIKRNGKPQIIQTDNGGEFKSNIFKAFCLKNDIKLIFGSPYHPQSQGAVEAFNKTII